MKTVLIPVDPTVIVAHEHIAPLCDHLAAPACQVSARRERHSRGSVTLPAGICALIAVRSHKMKSFGRVALERESGCGLDHTTLLTHLRVQMSTSRNESESSTPTAENKGQKSERVRPQRPTTPR